jgi:hypothetical protein
VVAKNQSFKVSEFQDFKVSRVIGVEGFENLRFKGFDTSDLKFQVS